MKQYQIDRIKDLMYAKGVTLKELAFKCGVSEMTIRRILTQGHNPTTDTVERIDDVIGDDSLDSVIFDLPYMVSMSWGDMKSKIMELYSSFDSVDELISTNKAMLELATRKIKRGGILVVKTQDSCVATPSGAKQLWVPHIIQNHAETPGLTHEDTFLLVSKKLMFTRHNVQQHRARKNHCYFLVFRK